MATLLVQLLLPTSGMQAWGWIYGLSFDMQLFLTNKVQAAEFPSP